MVLILIGFVYMIKLVPHNKLRFMLRGLMVSFIDASVLFVTKYMHQYKIFLMFKYNTFDVEIYNSNNELLELQIICNDVSNISGWRTHKLIFEQFKGCIRQGLPK